MVLRRWDIGLLKAVRKGQGRVWPAILLDKAVRDRVGVSHYPHHQPNNSLARDFVLLAPSMIALRNRSHTVRPGEPSKMSANTGTCTRQTCFPCGTAVICAAKSTYQFLSDAYDSRKPPALQSRRALARGPQRGRLISDTARNVKGAATMGAFQTMLSAGIATLAVGGGSLAQTVSGPSMEDLLKADNDSANWILPAHNYSANRQVEESEIGPQNIDQMKVAWTFKLPGNDPVETAPIVWGGTVYVTSGRDDVFALDAKTGEVKWQYRPNARQQVGFPRNPAGGRRPTVWLLFDGASSL
jgi:hypothetical protein